MSSSHTRSTPAPEGGDISEMKRRFPTKRKNRRAILGQIEFAGSARIRRRGRSRSSSQLICRRFSPRSAYRNRRPRGPLRSGAPRDARRSHRRPASRIAGRRPRVNSARVISRLPDVLESRGWRRKTLSSLPILGRFVSEWLDRLPALAAQPKPSRW